MHTERWNDSARPAPAASLWPVTPRVAALGPQDICFVALLNGFRGHGGLQRLSALQANRRDAWNADAIHTLPARVADRTALGFTWNHEAWLPCFQFDGQGTIRQPAAAVYRELTPSHDPWKLAAWFVAPSTWLQDLCPIDLLETAPARVLEAARADRYVANGG